MFVAHVPDSGHASVSCSSHDILTCSDVSAAVSQDMGGFMLIVAGVAAVGVAAWFLTRKRG